MAKAKPRHAALIILFCGFLGLFAVLYIALPAKEFSETEKRVLARFPEVSPRTVFDGSFESGFESWLSDHVPFRDALVGLHARYELASGRNGLSGVILGGGERLFAAPGALSPDDIARKCARINAFAETTGLPTSVLLIPESGYLQADALPALHAEYRDAELAELVRAQLADGIDFIWPEDDFRAHADEQLYYRTDHHLTSLGAHEAWRLYADSLGLDCLDKDGYEVESVPGFYGSMYSKSGLWSIAPDDVELWRSKSLGAVTVSFDDREAADGLFFPEHLADMDKYPVFLDGNHGLVIIETGHEGENLLMVRDSFGHCFAPFAADGFARIVLVDLRYFRRPVSELAAEQAIDRVLFLYGADTFMSDTNFGWLK